MRGSEKRLLLHEEHARQMLVAVSSGGSPIV